MSAHEYFLHTSLIAAPCDSPNCSHTFEMFKNNGPGCSGSGGMGLSDVVTFAFSAFPFSVAVKIATGNDHEVQQDIAEYAVMLAVLLVIVISTVRLIVNDSNTVYSQVGSSLTQ